MMNNNKILTVSYGTFSCTLEGFDDSFGTMKAIAEYFRDLASDDRYFGAEPPQPDAEMLQRIAQKEISRRVEAREHEGKIVLSAHEPEAPAPAAPAAIAAPVIAAVAVASEASSAPAPAATPVQDDADADTAQDAAQTDTPDATASDAQIAEPDVEAYAAKAAPVAADDAATQDETDIVPGQSDAEVEAFFDAPSEASAADTPQDEAPEVEVADAEAVHAEAGAQDSIAAKLQRIRAVVAQHDDDEDDDDYSEDEHAESNASPRMAEDDAETDADAALDIEDVLGADDAEEDVAADLAEVEADAVAAAETDSVEDEDVDDIADILMRLEGGEQGDGGADTSDQYEDVQATSGAAAADDDDDFEDIDLSALTSLTDDDADADVGAADEAEATRDSQPATAEAVIGADALDKATAPAAGAPQVPRTRARVIKVKRADLEAAIENGGLEEYDEADEMAEAAVPALDDLAPARTAGSSLSSEDEDALARELAELEADIEMDQAPESADALLDEDVDLSQIGEEAKENFEEDSTTGYADVLAEALATDPKTKQVVNVDADDARALEEDDLETARDEMAENDDDRDAVRDVIGNSTAAARARAALPEIDADQGNDVSRLLAEADHQMDEPESATRRDAFAHLRAAVAAKKADEAMGRGDDTQGGDDAYRNDLADVVRPRRPVSGGARTKRPGEGRPAPLKLVAEQRVDVSEAAAPAAPVRPRRVAAQARAEPTTDANGESFVDFAAEMGATKLPELLEAAAAYMSFVEGRDAFSRPQLMTKVRQAGPEGFSREDTLRSFGKLLRDGKIEKIKAGQFSASEDIGFHPGQRAVG